MIHFFIIFYVPSDPLIYKEREGGMNRKRKEESKREVTCIFSCVSLFFFIFLLDIIAPPYDTSHVMIRPIYLERLSPF